MAKAELKEKYEITLTLTPEEALTILVLTGNVGGGCGKVRQNVSEIYGSLEDIFPEFIDYYHKFLKGDIRVSKDSDEIFDKILENINIKK